VDRSGSAPLLRQSSALPFSSPPAVSSFPRPRRCRLLSPLAPNHGRERDRVFDAFSSFPFDRTSSCLHSSPSIPPSVLLIFSVERPERGSFFSLVSFFATSFPCLRNAAVVELSCNASFSPPPPRGGLLFPNTFPKTVAGLNPFRCLYIPLSLYRGGKCETMRNRSKRRMCSPFTPVLPFFHMTFFPTSLGTIT